ncbi:hypothetical protein ACIRG5_19205 [Lentzea sp. NPDC102401]|uniref:hypothetical protein n=1 Tax=Lentzea sp. NPDC102401 TaxID=3364128 RepID=UPI0037FD57EC
MNDVPANPKKTWLQRVRRQMQTIRETYGSQVTVPRVLGALVVRLLAEGLRYVVVELWKDLMRPW